MAEASAARCESCSPISLWCCITSSGGKKLRPKSSGGGPCPGPRCPGVCPWAATLAALSTNANAKIETLMVKFLCSKVWESSYPERMRQVRASHRAARCLECGEGHPSARARWRSQARSRAARTIAHTLARARRSRRLLPWRSQGAARALSHASSDSRERARKSARSPVHSLDRPHAAARSVGESHCRPSSSQLLCVAEHRGEVRLATRIVGPRGANANVHYSGGFLDRQVVVENELEHLTLSLGETAERVIQAVAPRFVLNLCIRRGKRIRRDNSHIPLPRSRFPLQQQSAQPRLAPLRCGRSTNHAEQPGAEGRPPVVARTSIKHCEIHGLKNLLGVVAIASTTRHRPAEAVGVRPLELSLQLDLVHCTLLGFDV